MSDMLKILQAKPNPIGRDKAGNTPLANQLLGEWVDVKNTGTVSIPFKDISLWHETFNDRCTNLGNSEKYWDWNSDTQFRPGETIRIHTGRMGDQDKMHPGDRSGYEYVCYANRSNFVLNNKCGDTIKVVWRDATGKAWKDEASYAANVPEGATLVRQGDKLVVAARRSY